MYVETGEPTDRRTITTCLYSFLSASRRMFNCVLSEREKSAPDQTFLETNWSGTNLFAHACSSQIISDIQRVKEAYSELPDKQ